MAYLLSQLLTESARRFPGNPAVIRGSDSISYGELDTLTGKLAASLRAGGIRPGDRVGIYMGKSIDSIVAIFGILKAGAVYVPFDWFVPMERLSFMAEDCDMRALVTTSEGLRKITTERGDRGRLAPLAIVMTPDAAPAPTQVADALLTREAVVGQPPADPVAEGIVAKDLAYILYTSGSTGRPKGVMLSHLNALSFVAMAVDFFRITPEDRLLSLAPLHFDLSIFDIFCSVKAGAAAVLVTEKESVFPLSIIKAVRGHGVTVWNSVPSALIQLILRAPSEIEKMSSLRLVLFAGELFPNKYLSSVMGRLPRAAFYNMYGQTEANSSTYYLMKDSPAPDDPPAPIGKAFPDFDVFALDETGNRVQRPGERGELYVRGPTVSLGYWRNPEKTAAHYVNNPLNREHAETVYKTGDIVSLDSDLNFAYIGRKDTMIKSRGFRIELTEIESVLYTHPAVSEAIVAAVPDEEIGHRLIGFILPAEGKTVGPEELGAFCEKTIPRYMIPEAFFVRERFPRTSTGKIDRQKLMGQYAAEKQSPSPTPVH